jgi:hypothetical protein
MSGADWVALIGAILAGIGGIISAWAAVVKARHEGEEDCEEHLDALRLENEEVADELHALRMEKAKVVGE